VTLDTTLDRDMARSKLLEARNAFSCGLLAFWPSASAETLNWNLRDNATREGSLAKDMT